MLRLCRLSIAALVICAASAAHADEPKVVKDAKEAAEWIATALSSSGYKADFTLESFKEIDRFVDDQTQNGRPRRGGLLAENFGARVFALGAYVGEVIRRLGEGQWHGDDSDPDAEINIEVRLKSAGIIWPMQRVIKRIKNGREDGIYAYGYIILKDERRPPNSETSPPDGR
jgi:hypothetical protein